RPPRRPPPGTPPPRVPAQPAPAHPAPAAPAAGAAPPAQNPPEPGRSRSGAVRPSVPLFLRLRAVLGFFGRRLQRAPVFFRQPGRLHVAPHHHVHGFALGQQTVVGFAHHLVL